MRISLYAAALAGIAVLVPPQTLRSAVATASSTLFEAMPFLIAGAVLSRLLRHSRWNAYLGCGCASGPSARSIPAAAAMSISFGPLVAATRFVAAVLVSKALNRTGCAHESSDILKELHALLPAAFLAAAALQLTALVDVKSAGTAANVAIGAMLGATAPCALGSVAVAGALHARAPLAAASFLCIAGIFDARALAFRERNPAPSHDAFAYALAAIALAIVAWRQGGELVHPALAYALATCSAVAAALAIVYRGHVRPAARIAPALMLAGALIAAPPPVYRATETTLTDLFPGERLEFTGVLTRDANHEALMRYAITCCRADASPVVVRLSQASRIVAGAWVRADGTIERAGGVLCLRASVLERIAPPVDPFIYR